MKDHSILNINKLKSYLPLFFSGQIVLVAASFISFPILTRLLSKEDYGLMGLITLTLLIVESIFSGGMRQSVQRFYGEYLNKNMDAIFYSTVMISSIFLGIVGYILVCIISWLLYKFTLIGTYEALLLIFASLLILIRLGWKTQQSFLRIQENAKSVNVVDISVRYIGLILAIALIFSVKNLYGFYGGLIIAEGLVMFWVLFTFGKKMFKVVIDWNIVKTCLVYGIPLMISSLSFYFLESGDRYVIGYIMGKESVADYAVAYNFSAYGIEVIKNVCMFSFTPLIMNAWNNNSIDESRKLIIQYVRVFSLIGFPMALGLSAIRYEGIGLLAGARYMDSAYLVPLLVMGILLNGVNFICNAGFLYKKKTNSLMLLVLAVSISNILLNILLVPVMGILGAAITTTVSYFLYAIIGGAFTMKVLKISYPWVQIIKYLALSIVMYFILILIPWDGWGIVQITFGKIGLAVLIYSLLIVLFDYSWLKRVMA